jgi:hypothetical protein
VLSGRVFRDSIPGRVLYQATLLDAQFPKDRRLSRQKRRHTMLLDTFVFAYRKRMPKRVQGMMRISATMTLLYVPNHDVIAMNPVLA